MTESRINLNAQTGFRLDHETINIKAGTGVVVLDNVVENVLTILENQA